MLAQGGSVRREGPDLPDVSDTDPIAGIRRGDVYSAELRDCAGEGRKISRPVLVVQNDVGNRYGNSVIVACVTTSVITRDFPVLVEIPRGSAPGLAAICLNQIMTVDKCSLGEKLATLSSETMAGVDEALRVSLGLPRGG
ncbi:MAG: type II toxin-antitoxin system PemK/MazF family toxin [Thermoleophilia bacterium]